MFKKIINIMFLLSLTWANLAKAELEIVITEGVASAQPIAIIPFSSPDSKYAATALKINNVISSDLARSGKFRALKINQLPQKPNSIAQIDFKAWRSLGVNALLMGNITIDSNENYVVDYKLVDITQDHLENAVLFNLEGATSTKKLRQYSHKIADKVYQTLTGSKGAFLTRIAYVVVTKSKQYPYQLRIADYDGYNEHLILRSTEPVMSPSWSPDGRKLAYVSFEKKHSQIYIQDLYTGKRELIASYPRHNGSPRFSPDGNKIALVLSKTGSLQLYILNLKTKRLNQITNDNYNNTEPFWTPDGKSLVYTSDKGGRPQIYKIDLDNYYTNRVTWNGIQNLGGQLTPDGKQLVMVHKSRSGYNIAIEDLDTEAIQILTNTTLDESPSIAPNGSMVIYSSVYGKTNVLSLVSTDGRFKARLPMTDGRVRSPAWSPFLN